MSTEELITSLKPYILLQISYGEDEFEEDYYYIETPDFDKAGKLKDFTIDMYKNRILIIHDSEKYEINININGVEFENLKIALIKIANKDGQFKIYG